MKKVFLSLAAIAFVAAGSLTVTSCGSDDSTPGVTPPAELTENFVKFNNDQYELFEADYMLEVNGEYDQIYKGGDGEGEIKGLPDGYYMSWTTAFYSADIQSAQTLADIEIFGQIGYYIKLRDVVLDDEGFLVDYKALLPHQAEEGELFISGIVMANYGQSLGKSVSKMNFRVNSFDVGSELEVTSDFDASFTFDTGVATVDFGGKGGLIFANVGEPESESTSSLKLEAGKLIKASDALMIKTIK